ncbi:MAG: nitrite/sulfite reductase [Deltaproteobacteria bacterium]|nr:nitrite/sulfite reductase [Deltaproteobacteria bacterium]
MQESTKKTIKEIIRDLPQLIREELDYLEKKIRDYQAGLIGEIKFQKIRLQMGTYAQRQNGVQMQRIKIPYGGLTSNQLRRLADVSEKYASGFMHLTTRQDVQIYYVKLPTVPNMMRELADAGITTREACGNTVRNVTACFQSGISKTETFDVTPYTEAFVQFMLRNPICQNMGRKFKVAFEGCSDQDHAGVRIHDLGFRSRVREIDGELKRGFQLYFGGGLGASPSLGYLWSDFIPVEEMLPISASIIRIFDRYGERKVRMKARMKFLIRKLGFEEFRKRVEEERAQLKVDPAWNDYLKSIDEHEKPPESFVEIPPAPEGIESDPGYLEWRDSCVVPHREDGYKMVHVRIKVGDIESDRARKLADIAEIFSGGRIRITIQQNFVLRWVPEESIPSLYAALRKADLTYLGADTFEDITACPGADTCRLGITSAKGLAARLSEGMSNGLSEYKEMAKDLKIKISGCPNACAQHVSANIGFQGASINHEGRTVPAEMVFVGGSLSGDDTRLAMPIKKIPTRNAPKVVKKLLELYKNEKQGDEHFDLVMQRLGADRIKEELEQLTPIPSFEEDPSFYQDWGHEEERFQIQQGVKGECAGATVEEKVPTFKDAEKHLEKALAFLHHGELRSSIIESYQACSATGHVPLYTKLVDPFTDEQTIWEFENMLVRTGEADKKWIDIAVRLKEKLSMEPTKEIAEEMLAIANEMHSECQQIQMNLTQATKN